MVKAVAKVMAPSSQETLCAGGVSLLRLQCSRSSMAYAAATAAAAAAGTVKTGTPLRHCKKPTCGCCCAIAGLPVAHVTSQRCALATVACALLMRRQLMEQPAISKTTRCCGRNPYHAAWGGVTLVIAPGVRACNCIGCRTAAGSAAAMHRERTLSLQLPCTSCQ